jgi:hypothetical protein
MILQAHWHKGRGVRDEVLLRLAVACFLGAGLLLVILLSR